MGHPEFNTQGESTRGRPRRAGWFAVAGAVIAVVVTLVFVTVGLRAAGARRPVAASAAATRPVDTAPFVGTWHVHTIVLVIAPDGTGTMSWPTHTWCDAGVTDPNTACDRLVPAPYGQRIVDGGRARIQLVTSTGVQADAIVAGSTDPSMLADGPMTLSTTSNDVLTFCGARTHLSLCGPSVASLTVEQHSAEGINCGA